jgi:PAS domain S-box-containing protein
MASATWKRQRHFSQFESSGSNLFPIWETPPLARQNSVAETLLSPSILEAIPDAVVAVKRQGDVIQANSQTEALFFYTRDELMGQKIEILVPERQRPEARSSSGAISRQTQNSAHGVRARSLRPAARWVGVSGGDQPQPYRHGGRNLVLSVIRDISARKRSARATLTSP